MSNIDLQAAIRSNVWMGHKTFYSLTLFIRTFILRNVYFLKQKNGPVQYIIMYIGKNYFEIALTDDPYAFLHYILSSSAFTLSKGSEAFE